VTWDAQQQYRSPEDLAEAKRIYKARWQKAFKEMMEVRQQQIVDSMRMGASKDEATAQALGYTREQITGSEGKMLALVKGATR
jgi:hypothetical protein